MPTTEKILKTKLAAEINSHVENVDNETDGISGETYAKLLLDLRKLADSVEKVAEDDEAALNDIDAKLKLYNATLQEAKDSPSTEVASEEDNESHSSNDETFGDDEMDDLRYEANELTEGRSIDEMSDYYLALSTVAMVSATDRFSELPELKENTQRLKRKLAKIQKTLDEMLANSIQVNNAYSKDIKNRLDTTKSLFRKVAMAEQNISKAQLEQTEYGYYCNKEMGTDTAVFFNNVADAQNSLVEYFKRSKADEDGSQFEIASVEGVNANLRRQLDRSTLPEKEKLTTQARFIPSTFKNNKNQNVRYGTIQAHNEQSKQFNSQVYLQGMPKSSISTRFGRTSIPGRELIMIAHDTIENHRMMNKFYPDSKLIFTFGKSGKEMAAAVELYCKLKKYSYEIRGVPQLKDDPAQMKLLEEQLGVEFKDIAVQRLLMSKPEVVEETRERMEPPRRAIR